jgi:hypothetical protein
MILLRNSLTAEFQLELLLPEDKGESEKLAELAFLDQELSSEYDSELEIHKNKYDLISKVVVNFPTMEEMIHFMLTYYDRIQIKSQP